jgi:PAS domain S-box-containing protein
LQAFADHASVAIQNAILYDEVSRHAAELEQRVAQRTIELQRAKEHVEAILNTSGDGIILIDADGSIQQANPAFNQMFNFTEEVRHQSFQEFVEPSEREKYAAALSYVTQQRQTAHVELTCVRKDGTLFDAEAVMAPLAAGTDEGVRIVCNLRDISQRKRLEAEIRQAFEKEKELNELKSRFITTVSHEFRTPLAIILVSSHLLKNHRDQMSVQRQREHFEKIEVQVRHMTEMMECVLSLSQVASTGMPFNPEPLNLKHFCQTVVDEIRLTASAHEIQFAVNGNYEQAAADPKLMRSILYNLLSNAVKYSPQGSVVSLELSRNQDAAIIRVTDQGVGIPEADLKHLFEVFHRASNVGNIQGTGLGLAIVKRAVETHRGSISVESAVGKGTTFIVTIPLTLPE